MWSLSVGRRRVPLDYETERASRLYVLRNPLGYDSGNSNIGRRGRPKIQPNDGAVSPNGLHSCLLLCVLGTKNLVFPTVQDDEVTQMPVTKLCFRSFFFLINSFPSPHTPSLSPPRILPYAAFLSLSPTYNCLDKDPAKKKNPP